MGVHAKVQIGNVQVVALNRLGGFSSGNFAELNLADYVGDESSNVARNIIAVRDMVDAKDIAVMSAQHSNKVIRVSKGGKCSPSDVLLTSVPNLALLALGADCVTVALIDSENGIVGVIHSGWQGLVAEVMQSAIDSILANGAKRENLVAVIGPSICGECYEVAPDRIAKVSAINSTAIVDANHIDLTQGIRTTLVENSVSFQQIAGCTFEDENLFSYRRADGQPTGRGGLVVSISPDAAAS